VVRVSVAFGGRLGLEPCLEFGGGRGIRHARLGLAPAPHPLRVAHDAGVVEGDAQLLAELLRLPPVELFAWLYENWSALERFQRTRGVLRIMAAVVHALWARGDQATLILPASVPLDDASVLVELTRHLEDNWKPVVDADVDGDGSLPATLVHPVLVWPEQWSACGGED
jgi:hypothetical protein